MLFKYAYNEYNKQTDGGKQKRSSQYEGDECVRICAWIEHIRFCYESDVKVTESTCREKTRTKDEEDEVLRTCKGEAKGIPVESDLYALVCLLCCCIYSMFTRLRIMA